MGAGRRPRMRRAKGREKATSSPLNAADYGIYRCAFDLSPDLLMNNRLIGGERCIRWQFPIGECTVVSALAVD